MLDLLQPGQGEIGSRVPVEQEPAHLGQQLGIRRIPAVNGDGQQLIRRVHRSRLGGLVFRHPPGLPRQRPHVARADTEILEQPKHVRSRWQAERRAEDEPDEQRRGPADGHAAQHVERQPIPADRPGQRDQPDEDFDDPLQAAGQVGQRGRGHRHEQGDLQDGKAQVVVVQLRPAGPSALAAEQQDEQPAGQRRGGRAQRQVAGHRPAPRDQRDQHQPGDDTVRADLVDHRDQPGDAARRRVDDLDNGPVDARVVVDDQQAADQGEDGEGEPGPVGATAAALPVPYRGEQDGAPAGQRRWLSRGSRGPHRILSL